jgi:hypothetical protein
MVRVMVGVRVCIINAQPTGRFFFLYIESASLNQVVDPCRSKAEARGIGS